MIRFTPDTFTEAVLRPLAMGAPNAWVYIEIVAPDIRFLIVIVLALLALASSWRRGWKLHPTGVLLAVVSISFVPWLYTTGNGRYFMPILLAAGPLALGLIHSLSTTRAFRLALALLAVAIQGVALMANNPWKPWDSWGLVQWRDAPYFQVDLRPQELNPEATYVTISAISFSLLAPLFPPTSHWINLSSQTGGSPGSGEARRTQAFLGSAKELQLLLPSVPAAMDSNFQPVDEGVRTIDGLLAEHRLALKKPVHCNFFRSSSLLEMALVKAKDEPAVQAERATKVGLWACPLVQENSQPPRSPAEATGTLAVQAELALRQLEALCPRFFAPGQIGTLPMPGGRKRHYPGADLMVYVLDNGAIYYKYERSLNPHQFGTVQGILDGSEKPECHLRGRSGLPWEREI
ncbi:MAG TPA: hypothetical protein VLI46_09410 [Ramlibacter sp.]|nr:hypothetical protein [Ramlibacter sp.]